MTVLTPVQVWQLLTSVGFSSSQAITLTAISAGESGYNDKAVGDQSLANATWGPSIGLFQVRTLKSKTGTGDIRDVQALQASDVAQARAAWEISKHGTDFTPWTVFTTGKYTQYLGQVNSAIAGAGGPTAAAAGYTAGLGATPVGLNPTQVVANVRSITIEGVALVCGLALVGVGLTQLARPYLKRATKATLKVGKTAAKVAI